MNRAEQECNAIESARDYASRYASNPWHGWADWLIAFERMLDLELVSRLSE